MSVIVLPRTCSHVDLIQLFAEKQVFSDAWEDLTLKLPANCFLYPSTVSFLCAWGMNYVEAGHTLWITGNKETRQYLSRFDLFRHLNIPTEESFNRHPEQGRFIPLRLITDNNSAFETTNSICDLVLHHFDNARAFLPAMEWAVNEIIDNIRMHAQTPIPGTVCAQYYPKKHRLDIGIYDMGRGIKASLSEAFSLQDHEEAISTALQKGVTRNPNDGAGNGLAGSVEISRLNGAEFHLWSGDRNFCLSEDGSESFVEIPAFWGTGVFFRLNTEKPVALEDTFIASKSSWNYLNIASERIKESGGIRIKENCQYTGSREAAQLLRRKILNLLPDYEDVLVLDFTGITTASSSFLDELLGKLAEELGGANFRQTIQLINLSSTLEKMANTVINERIEGPSQRTKTELIKQTADSQDEVILHLIASGILQLANQIERGLPLTLPYPTPLQRGLDRLAALCIQRGVNHPQGVPDLLGHCHLPLIRWPLQLREGAIGVADVFLENNRPTELCVEWAYPEKDVEAEVTEQSIMSSVLTKCRNANVPDSYKDFRRLLIEKPVLTAFEFQKYNISPSLQFLSEELTLAYQKVPLSHARNGYFYCCSTCGNLLWPTKDDRFTCENKLCKPPEKEKQKTISQEEGVLWLKRGLRRFVSLPGRFELRLEAHLIKLLGKEHIDLWPDFDRYDLRLTFPDNEVWAIDAKDWANPFLLAQNTSLNPLPNTPPWQKAFYVFPNERRQQRPDYVRAFASYFTFQAYQIEAVFERDLLTRVKKKIAKEG